MVENRLFSYLTLLASVALASCSPESASERSPAETFPVTHPLVTDTVYANEYVADIQSVQNVQVRARVSGYLDKILVDEGALVKKGQLLFTISGQEYREELVKAKAMYKSAIADAKSAEVDLKNVQRLVDKGIVSTTELAISQSRLEACQAKIEEARAQESGASLRLAFTEIRAPFDGVIDRIPNKVGSLISEGDLLTSISDNSEVFAYFNVSEREYLDYVLSDNNGRKREASLILANNRMHDKKGIVETVEGKIDKSTGNIAFRARFPNNDGILKHGASGKVLLQRQIKNALIIPQKSTFEIQENTCVYVVDNDNVVHMRKVVPEVRMSNIYVIASGLSASDRIIYEGIQRVGEGDKVSVDQVEFKPILAQLAR